MILSRASFGRAVVALLWVTSVMALYGQGSSGFEGWPESWIATYQRFEKFNEAREKYFPPARFEILADGTIIHSVKLAPSETEKLTLELSRKGAQNLGMDLKDGVNLFSDDRSRLLPPGIYKAALKTSGVLGRQGLYPSTFFEVFLSKNSSALSVRVLPSAEEPEDLPSRERLSKYADFYIFPGRHRLFLVEGNDRVRPCVLITVTSAGLIERNKLEPALEKLLWWRIYHDGELVEMGSARDQVSYPMKHGMGSCHVSVGVQGPNGYMPVSNLLHFPLFPEKGGGLEVLPRVTNPSGFPDFLLDVIEPEQLERLRATVPGADKSRYYHPAAIRQLKLWPVFDSPEKERLFRIWSQWGWDVNEAKGKTSPGNGCIRVKAE